jgi:hypothetical protein
MGGLSYQIFVKNPVVKDNLERQASHEPFLHKQVRQGSVKGILPMPKNINCNHDQEDKKSISGNIITHQ